MVIASNSHLETSLQKENNGIIMVNFYPGFVADNATIQDVAGKCFLLHLSSVSHFNLHFQITLITFEVSLELTTLD